MIRLVISVLCSSFVVVCCVAVYSEDDRDRVRAQSQEAQRQQVQQQIRAQQARPILPPVVPTGQSMISPTPSPHMTAPQIAAQAITMQQPATSQSYTAQPVMQNIPSAPAYLAVPSVPIMPQELPQVPIMGNAIGKVLNTGSAKDGIQWIEVTDELFGSEIKVKLMPTRKVAIVKQNRIMYFSDIKIGDTINIIYTTENEENIASFISIMTEEELELMNQAAQNSELTVSPETKENSSASSSAQETIQPPQKDTINPQE